jgi:3beta-hydroxy-Delta5-steroid dehydrogenase / steroid Delta-isomerase
VKALLDRGYQVRSLDRAPSPLPQQPGLEVLKSDICDPGIVAAAVDGIDTVFHTAALIELLGGASVTEEYRQRSFAVNVGGTENLVVVMGGKRVAGGDETLPYTDRFNDLYTETKVVAQRFVLSQNASPNGGPGC